MKKLSVKDLIDFKRKSEMGKKIFVENIKSNKIVIPKEAGGDYWVSCLSAICNSYKNNDLAIIDEKISELIEKSKDSKTRITKNMYQRNIDILRKYKGISHKKIRPNVLLNFLKRSSYNPLLTIKGLEIETKPSLIFTFGQNEEKVGSIWFIAKIKGYNIAELSIFCEMLYRFLKYNYSRKFELNPKFCLVVDVLGGSIVDYSEFENGTLSPLVNPTLDEINKLI
jgi:hypothetical protein